MACVESRVLPLMCLLFASLVSAQSGARAVLRNAPVPATVAAPTIARVDPIAPRPVGALLVDAKTGGASGSSAPLRVEVRATKSGGIGLSVRRHDQVVGRAYLIVFLFDADGALVPVAALDAGSADSLRFGIPLDVFASLPLAIMAVVLNSDGKLSHTGEIEPAAQLVAR